MKSLSNESTSAADGVRIMKKADEDDLLAPETDIVVFEPVDESTTVLLDDATAAILSTDDDASATMDDKPQSNKHDEEDSKTETNHPNNRADDDELLAAKIVQNLDPVVNPDDGEDSSYFDVLDSEEIDHQSWENVKGNEQEAQQADPLE